MHFDEVKIPLNKMFNQVIYFFDFSENIDDANKRKSLSKHMSVYLLQLQKLLKLKPHLLFSSCVYFLSLQPAVQ